MDTSWWLALAAVVLLALVATLVDGWGRGRRRPGGADPPAAGGRADRGARPQPGEIWWANVPYEDGPASKGAARSASGRAVEGARRPRTGRAWCWRCADGGRRVAKITSKYHDERAGVIALPPGSVGDAQGRPSFLETDELREVPVSDFRRRAGVLDPVLWDQVRHLAG